MRTETNRRKVNRLYILGAGSSYALTDGQSMNQIAPHDTQFCERISTLKDCRRPVWVPEVAKRIQDEYLHHIDFQSSGLEELIRQQLSDYEFINAIHPRRSKGKRTKDEYLYDLIHLVSFTLSRARTKDQTILNDWLTKYFKGTIKRPTRNRIISFNYDTLIDDVLHKWHSPQHIYFDNIWTTPSKAPKRLKDRYPLLLKLHGSLNWRCATTEYNKIFNNSLSTEESRTATYGE